MTRTCGGASGRKVPDEKSNCLGSDTDIGHVGHHAQTTDDSSESFGIVLNEFCPVLYKVMTDRCFGYLVGGNARPLNVIYQAQQLERRLYWARPSKTQEITDQCGSKLKRSFKSFI